jgi:membrane-bound hydrogenase subunit alpha
MLWLGLAGHFIGYNTVWMWVWKYREIVCDIFEKITGNRQSYAMFKVGGVRRDILDEEIPWIQKYLGKLKPALDLFKGAVMDDPVIHARTKGVGVLTKEQATAYCVVGPTARPSGIAIDVRKDDPYFAYDWVDWDIVVLEEGDVFAKTACRILEMYESIKIIDQCLNKMKPGPVDLHVKELPPGEGIGRAEAPRGEVYHYVLSDGSNFPVRYKVRAPSYVNIFSNEIACVGEEVADAALVLAAVDPCYCCTERVVIVDQNKKEETVFHTNDLIKLSHEKTRKMKEQFGL